MLPAAPPLGWIGSIKLLSLGHRSWVAQQVVEMEALSVAPKAGGCSLGHRLIKTAVARYTSLGYRLMLGTFTTSTLFLVPYYQRAGFTVLGPGEGIVSADPLGMILHRPAAPHVCRCGSRCSRPSRCWTPHAGRRADPAAHRCPGAALRCSPDDPAR
ncbi:GNAT family N-acetyltransferase [Streptomyces sp. NPDC002164]|uniref:GNAT family N-acetyltransferase n=1 Tax=Streptomyces sp. NPDC002164 TaxID=3364633 RepID=UPI0036D06B6C